MGLRLAVSAALAAALLTSVGSLLTEMGAAAEPTRRAAKARPPAQAQRVNAAETSVRDDADLTVALPPNFLISPGSPASRKSPGSLSFTCTRSAIRRRPTSGRTLLRIRPRDLLARPAHRRRRRQPIPANAA
jgi:hypothetical protein